MANNPNSGDDREHEGRSRHRQQRTKNYVILALLVAVIVLIYAVTIIRMDGG